MCNVVLALDGERSLADEDAARVSGV